MFIKQVLTSSRAPANNMETRKQKTFKLLIPFGFLIIFLLPLIIVWYIFIPKVEWIAIVVALEVGIAAIMNAQINRYVFRPLFSLKINEVLTETRGGEFQTWYHLCLKNYGFSSAKNVRVKIRDNNDKAWVNLTLPYSPKIYKDRACIKNLSADEDCQFDIGFIGQDNKFKLALNIYPYNQKTLLLKEESQIYFLGIISDDTSSHYFKIQINNKGYKALNINIV